MESRESENRGLQGSQERDTHHELPIKNISRVFSKIIAREDIQSKICDCVFIINYDKISNCNIISKTMYEK